MKAQNKGKVRRTPFEEVQSERGTKLSWISLCSRVSGRVSEIALMFLASLAAVTVFTMQSYAAPKVTFQVYMGVYMNFGLFNPATDSVVIRGDFQSMAGDVANWYGTVFTMAKSTTNDSTYTLTVSFPDSAVGKTFNYKFVIHNLSSDTWENDPNRSFVITSDAAIVIPIDDFNRLSLNVAWLATGLSSSTVYSFGFNSLGYIFAGTNSGVYRSTDGGNGWTGVRVVTPPLTIGNVNSIGINFSGNVFAGADSGVYRSTDNGNSWTHLPLSGLSVYSLAVINSTGYIFAGTSNGVYRSADNGNSWTPLPMLGLSVSSLAVNNSTGYIFAGTNNSNGVYRSTDSGNSWTQVTNGLTRDDFGNSNVGSLAINSLDNIFAGMVNHYGGGGVCLSTNNGNSWTQVNNGLPPNYAYYGGSLFTVGSLATNSLGNIFAGMVNNGGGGVCLSTNNGNNWTQMNSGLSTMNIYSLAINSSAYIFAGTDQGVFRSNSPTRVSIAPSIPTLVSPADSSRGVSVSPTLTWNASTGATSYSLQVSTDPAFATTFFYQSNLIAISQTVSGLSGGTTYYWRANASNAGGTSGWSEVWNFTTIGAPPSVPALASPANGSSGVPTNPILTWSASTGATSYELQVSKDSTFATTTYDTTGLAGISKSIGGLSYQIKYYWRVNASNGAGTSGWSSVWSFTTSRLLGECLADSNTVLLLHFDETTGSIAKDASAFGNNGTATGTTIVPGRFGYARQFNGTSDYVSFGNSLTGKVLNSVSIEAWVNPSASDTIGNKIFYDGGDGEFELDVYPGIVAGFHVNLSNGGWYTVYSKELRIGQWNHLGGTYDGTKGILKLYVNGQLAVDSLVPSSPLFEPGVGAYQPTVGAYNRSGVYSEFFSGSIDELRISNVARLPQNFDLQLSPTNLTASVTGTTVNLNWQNGGGAVPLMRYKIYRGSDSTNVVAIDSTTSTSYQNTGLVGGTNYFCRIGAVDSTGFEGAWSYAAKATVAQGSSPPPPILTSPANGSTGVSTNPTLTWNTSTGATSYGLQVSADSTFATTTYDTSGLTTTSKSISGLSYQTKYYWRVNATDSAGTSQWSTVWSFATSGGLSAPTLVSPSNSSTGISTNPTLTWNASTGAASYRLQVSTDSTFATATYDTSSLTTTSKNLSGLSYQTKYYWRVNASNVSGTSDWSTVWSFTTGSLSHKWALVDSTGPVRVGMACAYDSKRQVFVIYGGGDSTGNIMGDTWEWNGLKWQQVSTTGPSNRGSHLMSYDEARANVVLFGGHTSPDNYFGDTWVWDGTNWTEEQVNGPSARANVAMAYDRKRQRVVLFGGSYYQSIYGDTWEWDGKKWQQISTTGPKPRIFSRMVYDTLRNKCVLFGGQTTYYGEILNDTWEWDGTSWIQVNTTGPSGRLAHMMAYDPTRHRTVLFGGQTSFSTPTTYLNDTWEWDGSMWTRIEADGPSPRSFGGMEYNSSIGKVIMFGGGSNVGRFREVWTYSDIVSVVPPVPTLATPANGATGVSANPTLTWNASTEATSYELQLSTILTFSPTVLDKSNITSTSQGVSGLSRGTTYYWRVNASDSNGTSGWSTIANFTTFTYPSSIQVSTQYTPPSTMDPTSYQIIGLPGKIDIPMSSVMSGTEGPDWRACWDNGADQNYYVEYDGTSAFDFQPGRAFWILSRNPFSVSQNASTVPLDTTDSYSISIHSGWNLISDPFEKSVLWSAVQSLNGTSQPIWAFSSGAYSQPSTMDPYQGYYFYNDIGLSFLQIPYVYGSSTASVARLASVADRNLTVALTDGSKEESSISVGVKSAPGIDGANIFAPPGDFQRARICIVDSTIPAGWKELVKDYRDTIGTGQQFDFYVKNKTGKRLKLSTSVGDGLSQYEVYLIDKDLLRSYNLKDSDQISIPSFNKLKNYGVLIGSKSFVDAKLAELLPKGFMLYQNYPNPFNPVTVIRFEVPSSEHVSVIVYDVLGRQVQTLMNANVTPGYYEIPFYGTTLASGVYFYRISAGSFKQVKKMILIK